MKKRSSKKPFIIAAANMRTEAANRKYEEARGE